MRNCLVRVGESLLEIAILDVLDTQNEPLKAMDITRKLKIYDPKKKNGDSQNYITAGILDKLEHLNLVKQLKNRGKWEINNMEYKKT